MFYFIIVFLKIISYIVNKLWQKIVFSIVEDEIPERELRNTQISNFGYIYKG